VLVLQSNLVTMTPMATIGACWLAFFIAWAILAVVYRG
jgi:hypothetical protein